MKRICRILPVLLVPLLLLAACKQEPPDAGSSEVSETLPEITNPTFVSVDIETLLTAAEVSEALGETVTGPEAYYQDAPMIRFASEDGRHFVDIMVADASRAEFDEMKDGYADLTEAPNLGEAGYWSADAAMLVVYREPYMLGVAVGLPDEGDARLVAARQVMSLVLQHLP